MNLFSIPKDLDAENLRFFIQRTQQMHVKTRIVSSLITALIIIFMMGADAVGFVAIWTFAIICSEIVCARALHQYEVDLETPRPETTKRITRNLVYFATGLAALYGLIGLILVFMPTPGPAIAASFSTLVLMNVASQHVLWPRMFLWTIPVPAMTLFIAAVGFGLGAVLLVCILLAQTISLTQAAVKSYSKLTRALCEARVQSAARAQADAANSAKSQFLAAMSHELRTPLNAIIGYSELMREDAVSDSRSQDITDHDKVLVSATRLLRMINDVLDVSKIEAGSMTCEIINFSVGDEILGACEALRPTIESNGNRLIIDIDPLVTTTNSDSFKFGQCILNLLSNAAKFTKDGTVTVSAWQNLDAPQKPICVSVADTGFGMTDEQMAGLFQPFTQGDNTITRQFGGTGLGLSLSRSLARLMGGDIVVSSVLGEGSCFTLMIAPQAAADEQTTDSEPDNVLLKAA